jgi:hypothetical protein
MRPGLLFLCLPLLLAGCSKKPRHQKGESPEAKALRSSVEAAVAGAGNLRLLERFPIPDEGSLMFLLETNKGFRFHLQALPRNDWPHGSKKVQGFLVCSEDTRTDYSLLKGSVLEHQLLPLLDQCSFGTRKDGDSSQPPNEKTRRWLTDRLRDRTLPDAPCD